MNARRSSGASMSPPTERAPSIPNPVEEADRGHRGQQAQRAHHLRRRVEPDEPVQGAREVDRQVLPEPALAETVERDGPDHHRDEQDGPGHGLQARQPGQRRPQADHALARLPHRQAREQVEVDRERLAVAGPRLGPEQRLRRQGVDGVGDRRGGQLLRGLAPARDQLDPGEAEQRERGRVTAPALGIRADAGQPYRPPRAERAEQVAEQRAGEHEPDPEVDQDERRREVVERRAPAGVAGRDHHAEQRDPDRAAGDLHRRAAEHAPEPGQRAPWGLLQARTGPQHREPGERGDEHDRRRPPEQPLRDRQRRALDEAVRLGARRRQRGARTHRSEDGEPRAARHSAVLSARSKASRPKEPSSRAVILPSLPTTKSHGSVCSLNSCSGLRSPLLASLSV